MAHSPREVLVVLGTRPEIIKLAPVLRSIEEHNMFNLRILHTGQHYDEELSEVFFRNLNIPSPDILLEVGSGSHGQQTADALVKIEEQLSGSPPVSVVGLGDTNAVLSAALAASKTDSEFVHLEAGIRSFDRSMPEEINRVVADQITDVAFAPTQTAVENLYAEGINEAVHMVGNTVVDACLEHASIAAERSDILSRLSLTGRMYAVATIHRPRNTDDIGRLRTIVSSLDSQPFPIIFPIHPRTSEMLAEMEFEPSGSLHLVEPLNYLDFLKLFMNSRLVVTDSGGIQEEASILEIPCLTVRPNTERPETVEAGVNELLEPDGVRSRVTKLGQDDMLHESMTGHPNLYGDGDAGGRICTILEERYS